MSPASPSARADLFIALRCEELPARVVRSAAEQLAQGLLELLGSVPHGEIQTWSTPRRLAVRVREVAEARPGVEQVLTGPAEAAAFQDGRPTAAAVGFARGKGVPVEALEVVEGPKGRVVAVRVQQGGERVVELVAARLEALVLGMRFPVGMRWQPGGPRWARPIHGLIALHGRERIPVTVAGVASGTVERGHRLSPEPFEVDGAESWVEGLRAHHVEPDREARRARIEAELAAHAARLQARLRPDPELIEEITDLVEWPVVVPCAFEAELLDLPPRLLVESMRVHQRVIPLWEADGERLTHRFLAVSNHPLGQQAATRETIARGNARVVGARFHDARFFYAEDRRRPLEEHAARLQRTQWMRGGGSLADKAERLRRLAARLAPLLGADPTAAAHAARLAKADLSTQMVGEFPELQGHVGRLLAALEGQPPAVALAIEEHYLPRGASDALPTSPLGRTVALADRLDTLAACFTLGIRLKGSSDPLGLRRAAHGLLQLQLDAGLRAPPSDLFALALDNLDGSVEVRSPRPTCLLDLAEFTQARLQALLAQEADRGIVDAVLQAGGARDPLALRARVRAMAELARSPDFGPLKATFKRVMGLSREHADPRYTVEALREPVELALHGALVASLPQARAAEAALDYRGALLALSRLKAPVDAFFEGVLVMAEDPQVRRNRLGLLRAIADEFARIADLTCLSAD